MRKYFCNGCGKEIKEPGIPSLNVSVPLGNGKMRLIPLVPANYGNDDLCIYCIIDAVVMLDDRKKVE